MPMRLLFIIDNLGSGGSQRQMVTLARGLKARGYEVEFFLYAPGDFFLSRVQEDGIPVFRHLKKSRYSLDVVLALRKRIRAGEYDLILAYMPTPNFYAIVAGRLMADRPRIIVSERNTDLSVGRPWQEAIVRRFYRLADFVVPNSDIQREILLQKHPWLKKKIGTIHNGLDLQHFCPPKYEPPENPFRLLAIGNLKQEKNALCLVRALDILAQDYSLYPQVSWVGRHFGETSPRNFAYGQRVKQEIADLGLSQQWHWLYEREDIVDLLYQHHALVHPSYREGFPNVVCEAIACGRPVILSDTLEHPDLIEHGRSGFLFDWREPRELAQAIKTFCGLTDNERHAMGQRGREYAEMHLSETVLIDKYEQIFRSLVD